MDNQDLHLHFGGEDWPSRPKEDGMVWPSIKGSLREPYSKGTSASSRAKAVPPTAGLQRVCEPAPKEWTTISALLNVIKPAS